MNKKITLEAAAKIFRVHPRTIVRALTGKHNTYWSEDINHDMYDIAGIAATYGITVADILRIIEGREALLKPAEAALVLKMRPRTFRGYVTNNAIKGRVSSGGVVRYLQSKVITQSFDRAEA